MVGVVRWFVGVGPSPVSDSLANLPPITFTHAPVRRRQTLCEEAMGGLRETNKFLTDSEPWKLKGDDKAEDRRRVRKTHTHAC